MTYRSVALYRWADHVDDEHVARFATALDELAAQVPFVRSVAHGDDVGTVGATFDYVVVVDVDTLDDWRRLRELPAYVLLVEELLTGHVADQSTGQFRLDRPAEAAQADGVEVADLSDDELMSRARRAAQASMDALLAEPDDITW